MINNKLLIPVALSTGIIITTKAIEINYNMNGVVSLSFYIATPLTTVYANYIIHKKWIKQTKRNIVISLIKQLKLAITKLNPLRLVTSLILTITAFLFYDNCLDIWKYADKNILPELKSIFYLSVIPVSYILNLFYGIANNFYNVKLMQERSLDLIPGIEIVEVENNIVTIISKKTVLDQKHKILLEAIINNNIAHIRRDKHILTKYHLEIGDSDYRQAEKGSIARLEQILINMKDKPKYINTIETDLEIVHKFLTILPIKRLQRQLEDIEHKLGLNKNLLNLETDKGYIYFKIKKNHNKIYLLDDVIGNLKENTKELSFVLGVNVSSGNIVVESLLNLKHLLIAGKTGSGKSCTFKCIIESLMYLNNNIVWYMLDFADSALVRYEEFQNVKYIENELDDINNDLDEILKEYKNRKDLFRKDHVEDINEYNSITKNKIPYLILAIDEANAFKSEMTTKEFTPIEKKIKILLQRGRKYGIFCIMAVQQTNDKDFVKSWKTQFTRIAHLLEDTIDCCNITTKKEYQQLIPSLDVGEFYVLSETDNYKLKGYLTNNKYSELYNILKKEYVIDDKNEIIVLDKETL